MEKNAYQGNKFNVFFENWKLEIIQLKFIIRQNIIHENEQW